MNESRVQPGMAAPYTSRAALPSEWDRRQWGRVSAAQQYLKVDGLTIKYVGPGETDAQAASIVADHPVPPDVPLYYFEVHVISRGDHGYIGAARSAQQHHRAIQHTTCTCAAGSLSSTAPPTAIGC